MLNNIICSRAEAGRRIYSRLIMLATFTRCIAWLVGLPAMLRTCPHRYAKCCGRVALQAGLLWFGVMVGRAGDTHYVSLDGTNDVGHSYTNDWSGAATNIQWAIDKAAASGDTVLVSNGTYNLTNSINISKSVTVRSLYGTNSIINGNYPAYTNKCVYMGASASVHPILDGFTITNGYYIVNGATNPRRGGGGVELMNGGELYNCFIGWNTVSVTNGDSNGGGGIYLNPSSDNSYTTVSNCAVVSNTVLNINGGDRNGGGILSVYAHATVTVCRVYGNYAPNGGGMYMSSAGLVVSNCTVYNNTALNSGGGIYASYGIVANCVVSNNVTTGSAGTGGGVYYLYNGQFMNSIIIGNRSAGAGGVDLAHGASMSNCQVIANISTNSGAGGVRAAGIPLSGVGSVISDCVIAYNLGKSGPGLSSTGSATVSNLVRNCLIYGNTNSGSAGGVSISLMGRYPYGLINCTIANNEAGTLGGGLYTDNIANYIANCIIYGNVTTNAGDNTDEVYNNTAGCTNNFWYNCAPTNLVLGQGNTTNNPRFIDAGNRNYRPGSGSPCVNTGTNMDWMTNSAAIDLDKRIRIRYGTVDMGAYEAIYNGTMYGVR